MELVSAMEISGEERQIADAYAREQIEGINSNLSAHDTDSVKHITATERTNWNAAKTHADSAHAPSNAQANVIETIKVNGTALTPSSKAVNITVPTKVSALTNDSGYITSSGTAKTISDTLPISKGGTGKTTGVDAVNALINSLPVWTANPVDDVYFISQDTGLSETYGRRKTSALWNYIKSKLATVATSGSYNDLSNKPTIPTVGNGTVTIKQAGTSKGTFTMNQTGNTTIELTDNNTTYSSKSAASGGTDVSLVTTGEKYTWNNKSDLKIGTTSTTAAAGNHTHSSYVNQNAFSNVVVGSTTITADSATDTLTLVAGTNITLTPDATNDKITISSSGGTSYTLPVATSSALGGVKSGTDITVDSSGNVSVNDDSHNHVISNVDGLQSALDGKAASSHTHSYAGSSSAGGSANSAVKLDSSAGSATQPVYFSGGKPVACTNTLGKSVPSNAVFTDTVTTATTTGSGNAVTAITASNGALTVTKGSTFLTAHQDISGKMDKVDPIGTGSFSLNRKSGSTVGDYSFAEGYSTTASGVSSHAEGSSTRASGDYSHAEGSSTAAGDYSHAEGYETEVSGTSRGSHSEGCYTIASGDYQHVQGKYNVEDETSAFIIGNGTNINSRSNAMAVDWNGNVKIAGDITNGSGVSLNSLNSNLATKYDFFISSTYNIYAIYNDKGLVTVYGYISGLATGTKINLGATKFKCYGDTNFDTYAILNFYNHASPYEVVGSLWINKAGYVNLYKPSNVTQGYISGTYFSNISS